MYRSLDWLGKQNSPENHGFDHGRIMGGSDFFMFPETNPMMISYIRYIPWISHDFPMFHTIESNENLQRRDLGQWRQAVGGARRIGDLKEAGWRPTLNPSQRAWKGLGIGEIWRMKKTSDFGSSKI